MQAQAVETPEIMDRVYQNVKDVRDAIGPKVDIGVDFHGRTTKALAKRLIRRL